MSINERLPMCSRCEGIPSADEGAEEHFEQVPYLDAREAVERYITVPTDTRHRVHLSAVKAEYQLPDPIDCSIQGAHRHNHGYVVETRCGMLLRLGSNCSSKLIDGFSRLERRTAQSREYHRFLDAMRTQLRELRQRFGDAVENERRFWAFRQYLTRESPELVARFKRHWNERASKRVVEQIPGIELWDFERVEVSRQGPMLREMELISESWGGAPPPWSEQQRFRDQVRAVRERVEDFTGWARRAGVLLTRAGMEHGCEVLDSRMRTESTTVFDRQLGREVVRQEEVFRRVHDRFRTTDEGILDDTRLIRVAWD